MYNPDGSELVSIAGSVPITTMPSQTLLTSALLGSAGVFTSAAMDVSLTGSKLISLTALCSVGASASNGFVLQQSDDSSTWSTLATQTLSSTTPVYISAIVYQRYWRVVYTNGATAQTGTFSIRLITDVGFIPVTRLGEIYSGAVVPVTIMSGTVILGAGSAAIGTVVLATGSSSIGNIGSISNALPTGNNVIGQVTSTNDATTNYTYTGSATQAVKASPGRLVSVLVTGTSTADCIIYDNASAASGTKIGYVPGGTALGTVLVFAARASNGITIGGVTGNAAFTVMYN